MDSDLNFMRMALAQAALAAELGEVPVGAVLVHEGVVLAAGHNRRETLQSPIAHAEVKVIEQAAQAMGTWRLTNCTLYVTLEPCLMCVGAAILARVPRLVFAARDPKAGAVCSLYSCANDPRLNHRIEVVEGVLGEEAAALLSAFFRDLRLAKQAKSGSVL